MPIPVRCVAADGGGGMTGAQITYIDQYRRTEGRAEGLADRARRRRAEALERRMVCIIQTTKDDEGIVDNVFYGPPRLIDLMARTGPEARITGVRMEPLGGTKAGPEVEQRNCDAVETAP